MGLSPKRGKAEGPHGPSWVWSSSLRVPARAVRSPSGQQRRAYHAGSALAVALGLAATASSEAKATTVTAKLVSLSKLKATANAQMFTVQPFPGFWDVRFSNRLQVTCK